MTILDDVKYGIGILPGNDGFDNELLMHLNATAVSLLQFGLTEFDVSIDEETDWPVLTNKQLEALVKQYLTIKVKIIFDPSSSQTIMSALEGSLPNLEGRINHIVAEVEAGG